MRHETILTIESDELQYPFVEIDKLSNTVIYANESTSTNTLLVDKILTSQDSIQQFNADLAEDISQELIAGFNSSVISVRGVPKAGQFDDLLNAVVGKMIGSNSEIELPTLSISVYEIYGDSIRDLINPQSLPILSSTFKGLIVDEIATVPIATPFDILNILKRVSDSINFDKTWIIYEMNIVQVDVESRFRIVETCSMNYSAIEKQKLVLTEGILLAESMVAFYEVVSNPNLIYSTNSTIPSLLEQELGGNTSVRWIGTLSEIDLESEDCLWLFKVFSHAREINNIPVTNTRFVVENQKRTWSRISKGTKKTDDSARNRQRELDLNNRINTLIKSGADMANIMQQYKKQVLEEKKKTIDAKILSSKLRDEVASLNEKIQGFYDKEKRLHFSSVEKVGSEKMMAELNQRLALKIKELEFHILQLQSGKEQALEAKGSLENEVEALKKHNNYLRDLVSMNSTDSKPLSGKKEYPTVSKPTKTMLLGPNEKNTLFDQLQVTLQDYRRRTREQIEKCQDLMSAGNYADLVMGLNKDLIKSYEENEFHLLAQISQLKQNVDPAAIQLRRELALYMNETQLRLEREKYSLLAKCSALEEEIL